MTDIYRSAVQGRRDFRASFRAERDKVAKLRDALERIAKFEEAFAETIEKDGDYVVYKPRDLM